MFPAKIDFRNNKKHSSTKRVALIEQKSIQFPFKFLPSFSNQTLQGLGTKLVPQIHRHTKSTPEPIIEGNTITTSHNGSSSIII